MNVMRPLLRRLAIAAFIVLAMNGSPSAQAADYLKPARWGLAVILPDGWQWKEPERFTALVLPPPDTPQGDAITLSLRNLHSPEGAGEDGGAAALADRLVGEMKAAPVDASIHTNGPFRWDVGPGVVMGRQVVADITLDGQPLRQWTVFLPSPLAPVVHMWQYAAPPGIFEQTLPDARAMLDSLRPLRPKDETTNH